MAPARVLVMGTGAVGGWLGAALADAGHDVVFVARGENLDALRRRGLRVTGERTIALPSVEATDAAADAGPRDLVLLAVKTYDLDAACAAVAPCGGIVLTLQNGVDAADRVRSALGDVVLAGSTNVTADLVEPGRVHVVSTYGRVRFGEPGGGASDRVELVRRWLDVPGVEAVAERDVALALWEKMAHMCAMAGLTTLYRTTIGRILADAEGRATYMRVAAEAEAVARSAGVGLPDDFVDGRMRWADSVPREATSSMLRDLERGKPLEIDALNGTVVRLGRNAGVPTPVNDAVYAGVRLLASARIGRAPA